VEQKYKSILPARQLNIFCLLLLLLLALTVPACLLQLLAAPRSLRHVSNAAFDTCIALSWIAA